MSLSKLAESIQKNSKQERYDSIKKSAERFLKNVYDALDIKLSTFTKRKEYVFDDWLTNYLTTHINNYNIPTKEEIKESFKYANSLSAEYLNVIKHFNEANFTGETFEIIKNKIKAEKDKIYKDFLITIQNQQKYAEDFNEFTFALIGRKLSIGELDSFITEVNHYYEEITANENEHITEKDIMLIDFLRLPNILKNIRNELSIEIISNNILNLCK